MAKYDDLVKRLGYWPQSGLHPDCYKAALDDFKAARDAITVLQAEQCVEVKSLEWCITPETTYKAEGVAGIYEVYPNRQGDWTLDDGMAISAHATAEKAKEAGNGEETRRILSAITTRPASEVRAEAHAAAIEAAAVALNARGVAEQEDYGLGRETQNFYRARDIVRALHTDASRAAIERIKREAREEALREAANKLRIMGDMGGFEILTALIEKEGV